MLASQVVLVSFFPFHSFICIKLNLYQHDFTKALNSYPQTWFFKLILPLHLFYRAYSAPPYPSIPPRGATGKHFGIFALNNLKTTFWMTNLSLTQSRPLFPKSGHFFDFKKSRGGLPSSLQLRACESCEYGWICINIPEQA